jgi:heat shock protein HtpX
MVMLDLSRDNTRRARVIAAGFVVGATAIGFVLGLLFDAGVIGAGLALIVAAIVAWLSYTAGDRFLLARSRARPVSADEEPRLHNIAEGVAGASGFPKPALLVVEDPALNAFATGRDPEHASLVVTRGLLEALNRVELEGVLGHELAHIQSRDPLVMQVAAILLGSILPFGALFMPAALSRDRESDADITGVRYTRYPIGLVGALKKLGADGSALRRGSRATAGMWIASPLTRGDGLSGWLDRRFDAHPPLEERISLLEDL